MILAAYCMKNCFISKAIEREGHSDHSKNLSIIFLYMAIILSLLSKYAGIIHVPENFNRNYIVNLTFLFYFVIILFKIK